MTKLTDTQLLILSKAAQRDDHAVEPPSTLKGAAAQKVVRKLIKDGLLAEAAGPDLPAWRREEDSRPVSLVITAAGLDAIGIAPEDREEGNEPETRPIARDAVASNGNSATVTDEPDQAAKTPRAGTKLTAVV